MRTCVIASVLSLLCLVSSSSTDSRTASATHVFTGTVSRVLSIPGHRYASTTVKRVEKGSLAANEEVTVEFCGDEDIPCHVLVRFFTDRDFLLLTTNGFEMPASGETEASDSGETEASDSSTGLLALSYLHATRPAVTTALDSPPPLQEGGLTWDEVLAALRSNWLSSRFLRTQRPLEAPSRRGLSGIVCLTRDVTSDECSWLEQRLAAGSRFRVYTGHTYGVISPDGIAVQPVDAADDAPFVELPASALRRVLMDPQKEET